MIGKSLMLPFFISSFLNQCSELVKKNLQHKLMLTTSENTEDAAKLVTDGTHQCVFFMNPTLTHHVEAVCKHNETMPQKSTDYFPKVQSGLVIQYIPDGEEI
ncbi:MAG: hypothetical protein R2883_03975 [Caldisericia bacterium]